MTRDLWRFALFTGLALLPGLAFDAVLPALLLAAVGLLAWQYRQLHRLLGWLVRRREIEAPDVPGVFEQICREIDFMRDRHRRRKRRLTTYLRQFQAATAALPDATVVLGEHDEIQWANDPAAGYLGIHWPRDVNQRVVNLLRHPAFREALGRVGEGEQALELAAPDLPELQLSLLIVPFGQGQKLLVARDVTRLHRANQVRRDFVANASHELRTPLTVLAGYLETLGSDEQACPAHWRPALEQMQASTLRMRDVIEKLLLLSRLELSEEPARPAPVDVARLLERILREAGALSGANGHVFSLEADAALWLNGDRSELYSAFANLVTNAVQYTPAAGRIGVRWYRDGHGAHLEVSDSGPGIAAEHLPRLTERFYRADPGRARSRGGSGLGLAIVKHVLMRHGGSLAIESEPGRGSRFRCDFPETVIAAPPTAIGAPPQA